MRTHVPPDDNPDDLEAVRDLLSEFVATRYRDWHVERLARSQPDPKNSYGFDMARPGGGGYLIRVFPA